jgi:ribose 5-phosphate isomerase A
VDTLGAYPLPIEVNPFGLAATRIAIEKVALTLGLKADIVQRSHNGSPFRTDGGHFILDASFGLIPDAEALANALNTIPGVVEHGLFINLASLAIIAGPAGVRTLSEQEN